MGAPPAIWCYTWGHYEGTQQGCKRRNSCNVQSGRYMTIWRRQPSGEWKVVLDMGGNDPPNSGDCCKTSHFQLVTSVQPIISSLQNLRNPTVL